MGLVEELEEWTLRELEQLARRLGIGGADDLSKPQLIQAIEKHGPAGGAKPGLFRRMLSFARSLTGPPPAPSSHPSSPRGPEHPRRAEAEASEEEPIQTRTLARLLSSQGHHQRALAIYEALVEASPGDTGLVSEMQACAKRARETKPPQRQEAPELVPSGPDEVVSVQVDRSSVLVSWEVSERGVARAERLLGGSGELTARLVLVVADPAVVVRTETRERRVERMGEWLVSGLPEGARTTASVGLKAGEAFVSIAHCPVLHSGPG